MRLLNLGLLEIIFIFVLALILLGPAQMIKLARDAGRLVTQITRSPIWSAFVETSRELRDLKTKIANEAAITDELHKLEKDPEMFNTTINEFISNSIVNTETIENHLDKTKDGNKFDITESSKKD